MPDPTTLAGSCAAASRTKPPSNSNQERSFPAIHAQTPESSGFYLRNHLQIRIGDPKLKTREFPVWNCTLPDGIELVKEDIFWPEGQWSFRRGDLVWGKSAGWRKYYEVDRAESYFRTAGEAMTEWERSSHSL
jgi:hypothetical protein